MTRVAPTVPAPSDILCEHCGYTLNGLPDDGRCPECGELVADSTFEDGRVPATFEREDIAPFAGFIRTTASVLFQPAAFYRTLQTRSFSNRATTFGRLHWLLASICAAVGIYFHMRWYGSYILALDPYPSRLVILAFGITTCPIIYVALDWITRLAAKLTAWEAAYRGIRLPYKAVLRALHYHAAHYLPVAIIGMLTVVVYQWLLTHTRLSYESGLHYLYVLCGEVIVGAIYLFNTYWISMRKMMYANR